MWMLGNCLLLPKKLFDCNCSRNNAMTYPLISEYIEAIKSAEDNFNELSNLRPVLDEDGQPIMTSGNFAVVFKMKDEDTGKLYAVKCFTKEQEGRGEAYRLIAEELEYVSSTYLTPIKFFERELFVDTNASDETEFPILLMDWVEGVTLDKYIREHIDDEYELSLLAYQFSRLAMWLIPQPFAHGDLKPDNILVREDSTFVLVDYDGMYVPAMKGQKARELGSPDFRHPSRTVNDFDEHIDDFSLANILLSLKAISLQPSLLDEYGASDRLLFSEKDYRNLAESKILDALKPLMQDKELATLLSLFILTTSQKNLSQVSFRLFNLSKPNKTLYKQEDLSTEVTEEDLANAWTDEYGVMYSTDRKRLLKIKDYPNLDKWYYSIKSGTKVICNEAFHPWRSLYIRESFASINLPESVECIGENAFFGIGLSSIIIPNNVKVIKKGAFAGNINLTSIIVGSRNRLFDSREKCNAIIETKTNTLIAGCKSTVIPKDIIKIGDDAFMCCDNLSSIEIPYGVIEIGNESFSYSGLAAISIPNSVVKIGDGAFEGNAFDYFVIPNSIESLGQKVFDNYKLKRLYCSESTKKRVLAITSEYSRFFVETVSSTYDFNNAWEDEYGAKYSSDKKRLISIPKELKTYVVKQGTEVICNYVFYNGSRNNYQIASIIENLNNSYNLKLESIYLPYSIKAIGEHIFSGCHNLLTICIPKGTKRIFEKLLPDYKEKLVEQ